MLIEHRKLFPWIAALVKAPLQVAAIWGWALLSLTLLWSLDSLRRHGLLVLTGFILIAMWLNKMTFSLMAPTTSGIFYTPLMLATSFALLETRFADPAGKMAWFPKGCLWCVFVMTLLGGVLFSLNVNHVDEISIAAPRVRSNIPKFKGIMIPQELEEGLTELQTIFEQNNCSQGLFLTLDSTPLLHYMLNTTPPEGLVYIRARYVYPEEQIMNALARASQWCVVVSENKAEKGWHKTKRLMAYLASHATKHIALRGTKPTKNQGDMQVYLGQNN